MNDRNGYIILNLLNGIGYAKVKNLLERFNNIENIFAQSQANLMTANGVGAKLAEQIVRWQTVVDLEHELEFAAKGGVNIITLADDNYPAILKEIYDPPLCLYVRGVLPDFDKKAIAVVGSRRVSNYGRKMARHLAESLGYAHWTVVSGLAYGVDAIAHQACLDAGGTTIAVLGSGLARIHPQDHIPLARNIIKQGGAIISEFPMDFPASRQSFPRRNRIVSGLCRSTLIIEAGFKSGALITANCALEQGRSVFAVPGQADNPQAKGCNKLIRDGAVLTEDIEDILNDLEFQPDLFAEYDTANIATKASLDLTKFNENERKVIEALQTGSLSLDELTNITTIAAGSLMSLMMKLEIEQVVSQLPGKIYTLA
jgi:DNA processing protein